MYVIALSLCCILYWLISTDTNNSKFVPFWFRIDADDKGEEHIRAAKLNLVDLAGSERQSKTGSLRAVCLAKCVHLHGYVQLFQMRASRIQIPT